MGLHECFSLDQECIFEVMLLVVTNCHAVFCIREQFECTVYSPLHQTTATLKKNPRNMYCGCWSPSTKYSTLQIRAVTPHYLLILPLFMGMGLMDYSSSTDAGIQPGGAMTLKMLSRLGILCRALDFYTEVLSIVLRTNRHSVFLVFLQKKR